MKIKLAILFFSVCLALHSLEAHSSTNNSSQKTVAVLLYNNQVDSTINNDYNIAFDYPAKFIVLNLKGNDKFNVLTHDSIFRFSNNPASISQLFDLLHVNAIVTGNITTESRYRKLIVQTKIYLEQKQANGISQVDSVYLPEQRNGYYYTDTLKKALTADLQNFFKEAITDAGEWDPVLFNSGSAGTMELYNRSKKLIDENNLSYASLLALHIIMHDKDSASGLRLAGIIELRKNNNDAAIGYFDRALKINVNDKEAIEQKGNALLNKGLYSEALAEFKKCSGDKKFPGIQYKMALCYFEMENDSILISGNLALKSTSDSAAIYDLLGRYFLDKKKTSYDSAIYYFQKAVKQDTAKKYVVNLNNAYSERALELMDQKKLLEALPYFKNVFESDSTAENLDIIRWIFTETGKYDSVDFYIDMGLNSGIYYLEEVFFSQAEYCLSASDTSNSELSKKHLGKVFYYLSKDAERNGEIFRILETKGTAYSYLNNNDSAIYYYNKAIVAYSYKLYTYLNLAELHLMSNKPDSAFQTVRQGLDHIYEWPAEKSKLLPEEEVLARFIMIVSKIVLNKDFNDELLEEKKLLDPFRDLSGREKQFITGWSFKSFQKWISTAPLEERMKNKINEQINSLKEFTNPELLANQ